MLINLLNKCAHSFMEITKSLISNSENFTYEYAEQQFETGKKLVNVKTRYLFHFYFGEHFCINGSIFFLIFVILIFDPNSFSISKRTCVHFLIFGYNFACKLFFLLTMRPCLFSINFAFVRPPAVYNFAPVQTSRRVPTLLLSRFLMLSIC